MSLSEKLDALEGVRVDVEEGADGLWRIAGSRSAIIKLGEVLRELPAVRQDMIDAERYAWLRGQNGMCDAEASVTFNIGFDWQEAHGDELDAAIDAARATGEGEGHD